MLHIDNSEMTFRADRKVAGKEKVKQSKGTSCLGREVFRAGG